MNDLDYYTTPELIDYINNRNTFAGIIFYSEARNRNPNGKWDITYRNITEEQASELLQNAAEHFKQLAGNDMQEE